MRPVKKALRALDNPDQTLSETEQMNRTRACLRQIGNQIDTCLDTYSESDKKIEWRSNLWYFVSKFTNFDAKKLYRLYKYGLKKGDSAAHDSKNDSLESKMPNKDTEKSSNNKSSNNSVSQKQPNQHNNHTSERVAKGDNQRRDRRDRDRNKDREKDKNMERERDRDRREGKRKGDRDLPGSNNSTSSNPGLKRKMEDGDGEREAAENNKRSKETSDDKDRTLCKKGGSEHSSRDRDRERERDRDRERDRERERRDSGGAVGGGGSGQHHWPGRFPDKRLPSSDPRAFEGARSYRPDRGPRIHDKRRYHPGYAPHGHYAGFYGVGEAAPVNLYPTHPHRNYPPDWRDYPSDYRPADYPEREYLDRERDRDRERERDYRREYERRPPPP